MSEDFINVTAEYSAGPVLLSVRRRYLIANSNVKYIAQMDHKHPSIIWNNEAESSRKRQKIYTGHK
jgi:hypothetical protein